MKKYSLALSSLVTVLILIIGLSLTASAHSGRTDGSGGHHDNKNASGLGSYHYHCGGYPAHLHPGGHCPYRETFPSSVKITATRTTLGIGETAEVSATVSPSNACDTYVDWECSNTDVVTLKNGVITAVGYGTAKITATSFNGKVGQVTITVKEITADKVTIDQSTDHLYIGKTFQASASITPENVDNPTLTWSSSDESIATVTNNGLISAVGDGEVRITATASNGVSGHFDIHVEEKVVESIQITEDNLLLYPGDTATLHAEISPSDASYPEVTWSSSSPTVMPVSKNGEISASKCGYYIITATASNGLTDSILVQVDEIIAEHISILGESSLKIGSQMSMSVSYEPENTTIKDIVWTSGDESILTIDEAGVITACQVGTTTITATQKDTRASMEITVLPIEVASVRIDVEQPGTVVSGDTLYFSATVRPENATYPEVTWSSNHDWIASIDENGVFQSHLFGKVVITASTADGISDSYEITVHLPFYAKALIFIVCAGGVGTGLYFLRRKKRPKN